MTTTKAPETGAKHSRGSTWTAGWKWFCWLPMVWFVLLIPESTTFFREGTWLQAANMALLLGEVAAAPLLLLLIGWVGRLRGEHRMDAFLALYPRSFLAGAIPAFSLFLFSGYFMAWMIRRGVLAPTPEFGEWLVSGRAHGQIGLLGLAVLWVVRAGWMARSARRFASPKPYGDLRRDGAVSSWIALTLLSGLYLSFLIQGKEPEGEASTSVILAAGFLLLEGLALGVFLRWGPSPGPCALASAHWLRLWGIATGTTFVAGVMVEKFAAFAGWKGSWRFAPAPMARLLSDSYDFDWRALANVLIYWSIRLFLCGAMLRNASASRARQGPASAAS